MSEVRLVVREAGRDWSGTIHGSCADCAIAALGADPVTLEELEAAAARFEKRSPERRYFANLTPGLFDEPYDAGLVVIDLIARLVVVDSSYSSAGPVGDICYRNKGRSTETSLRYHLADDWLFSSAGDQWQSLAEERRRERLAKPILDARLVFYGRPMLEFIATEAVAAFAKREAIAAATHQRWVEEARKRKANKARLSGNASEVEPPTEEEIVPKTWPGQEVYASLYYDAIGQIHADWLLTQRADLGGACPREIAHDRREHLTWDLQDRCEQWSLLRKCPRGLETSSFAYRYGGFGIHELVVYYSLIRELLWSCWDRLTALAQTARPPETLSVGDFLATEVPRLERVREAWLDSPYADFRARTARQIIERERRRLPEVLSRHEEFHDPDCPCCQMIADMPGPGFWHLDGYGMDDGFAFDIYRKTRAEWEEEQRQREEFNRQFAAKQAERERLGVADYAPRPDSIWSNSLTVGETVDVPLGVRLFGIGCRLAELIVDLRAGSSRESTPIETQWHIDRLNRDFGNLRELLQSSDSSLAQALIDPVLDRFSETLAAVASERPDLAERCESLSSDLTKLLDAPTPDSTGDLGSPF